MRVTLNLGRGTFLVSYKHFCRNKVRLTLATGAQLINKVYQDKEL